MSERKIIIKVSILAFIVMVLLSGCTAKNNVETMEAINVEAESISVLMYHYIGAVPQDQHTNAIRKNLTVATEDFEAQLHWLKENGFYTIPFNDLIAFVYSEPPSHSIPKQAIVLTFDDGYEDAYINAFPLLKKYGFKGAFAIITGKVGSPGYLTWPQILEMKNGGMEFLSHTVSHLDLRTLSDTLLARELFESKRIIEKYLQMEIKGFVYPAGRYDSSVIEMVKKSGYRAARTTKNGRVTNIASPYELRTIRIHGNTPLAKFCTLFYSDCNNGMTPIRPTLSIFTFARGLGSKDMQNPFPSSASLFF